MSFREILGHQRPIAIIRRAMERNRLPSAYLFAGPEGVGKKVVALNLAKALNCEGRVTSDCCDSCIPCRKIQKGIHPDVSVIEPEGSSLKIEQARETQRDISLKPYEGRVKVYIFNQAEKMTEACENALLKTLEEPTGETLLILITSTPYSLLPTVLSRTQRIRFDPLSTAEVASYLISNRYWEAERARFVASLSEGSLGRALMREGEDLFTLRDEAISALSSALRGGMGQVLNLAEAWAKERDKTLERLDHLLIWVRDLKIYQKTGEEVLLVNRDLAPRIREEAASFSSGLLSKFFEMIRETSGGISRYANTRLSLEAMLIRMRRALQGKEEMAYAECGEDQV